LVTATPNPAPATVKISLTSKSVTII